MLYEVITVSFGDKTKLNTSASVANNYGEYNLTLTATIDGCTSSDELSILFNEPPAMTLPKADSTFCAGESILMDRITSYNVCYTKLLRVFVYFEFIVYSVLRFFRTY